MKDEKYMNELKKILGDKMENAIEFTEEDAMEFEAYSLINPIQIPLNEAILKTLSKYNVEIVYNKKEDNVFVMSNHEKKATTLRKFLEIYTELLEEFIIHNLKTTLQKQNVENNLKSKIQIKAEAKAEEIKKILGEETFGILNKVIQEEAVKNFEKDLEKIKEVEMSENKKMC